jgi:malonyl-CoA/methylmalonyl-CoA synthetase
MASTLPNSPIFQALTSHDPGSIAVIHSVSGRRFTYGELLQDIAVAKDKLQSETGNCKIDGQRIAFVIENSYDYVGAICICSSI